MEICIQTLIFPLNTEMHFILFIYIKRKTKENKLENILVIHILKSFTKKNLTNSHSCVFFLF